MNRLIAGIISIGSLSICASALACTEISALPFAISQSGKYCFTQDLVFEGTAPIGTTQRAIHVTASDVTVDLGGFSMTGTGTAPASSTSFGVYAYGRSNVAVVNGRIRGFGAAIALYNNPAGARSNGYSVENVVVDGALFYGIVAFSDNAVVRNNRISNVVSGTLVGTPMGIYTAGTGVRIQNNHVANVSSSASTAVGISSGGPGALIEANTVWSIASPSTPYGVQIRTGSNNVAVKGNSIQNSTTTGDAISSINGNVSHAVSDNVVSGFFYAINFGGRLNAGKYRNTTTTGTGSAAPFNGGTDIGGNN